MADDPEPHLTVESNPDRLAFSSSRSPQNRSLAGPAGFRRLLRTRWDLVLFGAGLLAVAFAGGLAIGKYQVFPYPMINNAHDALNDWRRNWRHYLQIRSKYAFPTDRVEGGVTVHDARATYPGYTFLTAYRDRTFKAFLIDTHGAVRHEWAIAFSEVWPDPSHLEVAPPDFDVSIHGAALLPEGEVVLNFDGAGTVKLDRCSRVLWSVPAETHHAVAPLPNGDLLIPVRRKLTRPRPQLPGVRLPKSGWLWEDTVLRVNSRGQMVEEFSMLEVLLASGLEGSLYANGLDVPGLGHTEDPLHLNDVEMLHEEMAAAFPLFAPGDVMVSLRNLNMIAVLDGATRRVKWSITGPFLRQHDPDFLPNGHILVFDNRRGGRNRVFGTSRVLEIDPVRREVVWSWGGSERGPFYTDIRGDQQSLPNGNVLIVEAEGGRVFEVSRSLGGKIVWEWVNKVDDGWVGLVNYAERLAADRVGFLDKPCG